MSHMLSGTSHRSFGHLRSPETPGMNNQKDGFQKDWRKKEVTCHWYLIPYKHHYMFILILFEKTKIIMNVFLLLVICMLKLQLRSLQLVGVKSLVRPRSVKVAVTKLQWGKYINSLISTGWTFGKLNKADENMENCNVQYVQMFWKCRVFSVCSESCIWWFYDACGALMNRSFLPTELRRYNALPKWEPRRQCRTGIAGIASWFIRHSFQKTRKP